MRHIEAIFFDLDDTLWDMHEVIPRAEQSLYDWFAEHYPRVVESYTPQRLHRLRIAVGEQFPELRHDLSTLRMKVLRQVLTDSGYAEDGAADAFEVFQAARNQVTLYADVLPVLRQLSASHRLFALTNGNASLEAIGILQWFEAQIGASDLGVAKPDRDFFCRAMERSELAPGNALHVGDHPANDIQAAREAGMTTVWLNRRNQDWELQDCEPHHELSDLQLLPELLRS
jgi:putative hydrolase of the HAD superfamily